MKNLITRLLLTFMAAALVGCAAMSNFDQNSYDAATRIKKQAATLVLKATVPEPNFDTEVQSLKAELASAAAYEGGKGKSNTISSTQWSVMADENRDLLAGFLKAWIGGKTFSPKYLEEKNKQIQDGFDQILKLEGAKDK